MSNAGKSRRGKRFLIKGGSALLIIAILVSAFGVFTARRSFPQVDGQITLTGLDGPVDVYRDSMGIPQIYATTVHDLFMAQGYVHAQERFWQMDFWRHIGAGRLSEMFGDSQLGTDSFLRTLGWAKIAEEEVATSSPEALVIMNAYCDGVNSYLAEHKGTQISLEYGVLKLTNPDYQPEPWTPVNSLTWGKVMAWNLGEGYMQDEIERTILLKSLQPEQVEELYPPYPTDHPVIVPNIGETAAADPLFTLITNDELSAASPDLETAAQNASALDSLLGPFGAGIGSNSWAVAGSLTTTGMPLLANDPHLASQMPSIWFQVGLHCRPKSDACPYEVAGFSFAGVPGVVIGHNDKIAWGLTNTRPDVTDLYIEEINPDNPNQYRFNEKWVDMDIRTETINVAGADPVTLTIRSTRHGPIVSDTYGSLKDQVEAPATPFKDQAGISLPDHYAVAMRWTALEPNHLFDAVWGFNKAQNWQDFRQAARNFTVPAQNLLYADVEGNIGYQMPGNVPIRRNGDGTLPVPGWMDEYEWTGYIPFEQLPYALNPAEGYIVTANNQVNPRDYPYLITTEWDYGFRANRIEDMITSAPGKIDIAYIQQMQGDDYDANAATFVPLLASLDLQPGMPNQTKALDLLRNWDYQAKMDSSAAAVFEVFWKNLLADTFTDNLPKDYWPDGGSRWNEVMRNLAGQPDSFWWDDKATTDMVETRNDILVKAFTEAVAEIEQLQGKNADKWNWGDLHTVTFQNQTFGISGIAPIEALFNRGPFRTSGGESIVNATGWDATEGYVVTWLPSMRMIVDLGDLRNSITVHTTGESGHAYHPHYIDMADLWRNIEYYPMLWNEQAVVSNAVSHLVLKP